jgi:signal transduction histidine kinase
MPAILRNQLVSGLLLAIWLLVAGWQVTEHQRVVEAAKSDLRHRSREIASTLSAVTRALRFRGAIFQERLDPVLNELASARTNVLAGTGQLLAIGLLNSEGETVAAAGETNLLSQGSTAESERWGDASVTFVLPVEGVSVTPEGATNNPTVVLPTFRDFTNAFPHDPRNLPPTNPPPTNANGQVDAPPPPPPGENDRPPGGERPRNRNRPSWMRWMSEADFKALAAKRELHGLVLVMSTQPVISAETYDLRVRAVIMILATISALGTGLAWRNQAKSSELQLRLVRASELNSHLKEMNLAAAGLAHETRNPLNIIRGLAQMLSKQDDAPPATRQKSREIIDEADRVTAQLNEFINYAKPREVRRVPLALPSVIAEVAHTLNYDLEEKHIRLQTTAEPALTIEADEQLFRQTLFNLLLNAIQAVEPNGEIQVVASRTSPVEAALEIRDNGPGVAAGNENDIFKPYFTTHQRGTGLGLAVVKQIALAHGWDIGYAPNSPRGAVFRISHLKLKG